MSLASWKSHFDEICRLLESAERQYGVANTNYADVTIERLELAIQSVLTIRNGMNSFSVAGDTDMSSTINDYKGDLDDLIASLRTLLTQWNEYRDILDSTSSRCAFQVSVLHNGRRGRPRFEIAKEQIEYLLSISFTWTEIAGLLGISRMTLYRYSNDYHSM